MAEPENTLAQQVEALMQRVEALEQKNKEMEKKNALLEWEKFSLSSQRRAFGFDQRPYQPIETLSKLTPERVQKAREIEEKVRLQEENRVLKQALADVESAIAPLKKN